MAGGLAYLLGSIAMNALQHLDIGELPLKLHRNFLHAGPGSDGGLNLGSGHGCLMSLELW